ncbi:MAG: YutD family protein [Tetragenococcus koreensis]|nr:YutD family protein [Tetragenococcus koreensis]
MTKDKENITEEVTAVLSEIVDDNEKEKPQKGKEVFPINETEFMIDNRRYKLVANYREGFDATRLGERYSDVLAKYDYIVGDWGYEQLRLKGFFAVRNRKSAPDQKITMLEDYLYEYCNFGCAYFVIECVDRQNEKPKTNRRRKRPHNKKNKQAHVAEKTEKTAKRTKSKPVIKKKQTKEKKAKMVTQKETKEFVIRKKED